MTRVEAPFSLAGWLTDNTAALAAPDAAPVSLFPHCKEFQVLVVSAAAEHAGTCDAGSEAWLWQYAGSSTATVDGVAHALAAGDSLLVRAGQTFRWQQAAGGAVGLVVRMVPPEPP